MCAFTQEDFAVGQLILAVGQLIMFGYGLKIYRKQADEASKSRMLDATRLLIEELGGKEVREIRSWLLDECPDTLPADLLKDKERDIRRLIVAYDRVGLMVKQNLILGSTLFEFQRDEIEQVWNKAKPVIDQIRKGPRRKNYAHHFEDLATKWLPKARKAQGTTQP